MFLARTLLRRSPRLASLASSSINFQRSVTLPYRLRSRGCRCSVLPLNARKLARSTKSWGWWAALGLNQ